MNGEGMPISKRPGQKGVLRIKLTVEFPKHQVTDPAEIAELKKILG